MKILILSVCLFVLFFSGKYASGSNTSHAESWADSLLARMTLDEKIGQLFMIAAYSNQTEKYETDLEKQIVKYHVGGLIFFQGAPDRQVRLTNRYQKAAKYPLLIGMDAEHGAGWRLKDALEFPKMGIIGAIRNDSLVYALGATIARHCHELGVHINFAPVVDINSNPRNPIIGIRAFGEKPEEVSQKAALYIKGSLSQNVLPVAKHFPGHGDTDKDSHQTLPLLSHTLRRLYTVELYPYRALIKTGLPAVMTSHLSVPALDSSRIPASLSPLVVDGLLKEKLHFDGLCFTDAMNMKGVTNSTAPGEAEVKALLAGNDVLLFPENLGKAVQAIRQAVADSLISEALIDEKCRKILLTKHRYALSNRFPSEARGLWSRINTPQDFALKRLLYREALTLVKNNNSLLPLKRLDTLQIASLNFGAGGINHFQTALDHYAPVNHFTVKRDLSDEEIREWQQKLKDYNCIILYNSTANNASAKRFGYSDSLAKLIKALAGKRIIFCHPAIPYGVHPYMSLPLDAVLISYEDQLSARQYAAQGIFGGIAITGKLPVSINIAYPAGTGICTKKSRLGYDTPETCGILSDKLSPIDSICRDAIENKATPGCQVLIARNGTVIYNKAFGFHTYQKERPNAVNDIYDIASVTKITATLPALMKLYDEKRIALDHPLSEYYPELEHTDKKDLLIKEILCHNAGLKTFIPFFADAIDQTSLAGPLFSNRKTPNNTLRLRERLYADINYRFKDSTISNQQRDGYKMLAPGLYMFPSYQDTVLHTILHSPLNPQKTYAYSDVGFILLKFAIEQISGENISRYCQNAFYRRLGMYSTDFKAAERLPVSRIVPSCHDLLYRKTEIKGNVHDPAAAMLGGIAGNAGLFSTAEDLAKMLQMYLNKGNYGGEQYFAPGTIDTFTCSNHTFPENRRALGFDKPEPDTTKISPVCQLSPLSSFGHTGFTGIMAWCDPDNDLIYIFMSNRTYPNEFNSKLSDQNIRTKIQEVIYDNLKTPPDIPK
ncbi:MAG: serine hydrolase [Odoribacter sp.]|nr:serine hydrolase [Odoribacter sp.]